MKKGNWYSGLRRTAVMMLAAVLLVSSLSLSAFADIKAEGTGTESYNVTVKVAPSTATAVFYSCAGFTDSGYDIPGEQISASDGGIVSNYHIYTFTASKGTYSFRGTDANGNSLGGMTFDVPTTVNVDGTGGNACDIVIRQFEIWTTSQLTTGVYCSAADFTARLIDADGKLATIGSDYLNGSYTRYRSMLYAGGNAELYTYQLIPSASVAETYNLGTNTLTNQTVTVDSSVLTKSGNLPVMITADINAPTGACVSIYNQIRNFCIEEIPCLSTSDNLDGTAKYTYKLPKNGSSYFYRVKCPGKITKAGYMTLSADIAYTITFGDNEDPQSRTAYDTTTSTGKYMEDNILLNINSQNYLRLNQGDTFKVRAYRAAWQIVNTVTGNIMIEPDFHYTILSGDSVTLQQNSEFSQWAMLKAVKPGITVIEVTYDAIDITGNGNLAGRYNAIDPARKGLFVVNVGGDTSTGITMNIGDWDCEMDTVYFTGESGTFSFSPTSAQPITVTCNDTVYTPENGKYSLVIKEGNNLVEVKAGNTIEYLVLKGNKVTVNITNVTHPGQDIIQGDTVSINFTGLHMPVPKFSGIYNPGFGGTMKIAYRTSDGGIVSSKGTQYDFINNHTITFTVWDKGTLKLTGGTIPMTMMCDPSNPWGQHRTLTDTGVGANFNASEVAGEFSILPEIDIHVGKNEDPAFLDTARNSIGTLSFAQILCGISSYSSSFYINNSAAANAAKVNSTAVFSSINPSYALTVKAIPVNSNVSMEFRYWEEGDSAKHVFPLTAGQTLNLGTGLFSGDKMIHMEIAVRPLKPIYGEGQVYSYTVYKNTAGFVNPILKTLSVLNEDGSAFSGNFGVLYSENGSGISYTQNKYTVYVPEYTSAVKLQAARVIGSDSVQINNQSQTVATSNVAFDAIPLSGDTTVLPIAVMSGSYVRNYQLTVIRKSNLDIEREKAINFLQDALDSFILSGIGSAAEQAATGVMNAGADTIHTAAAENINSVKSQTYSAMEEAIELTAYKENAKASLDSYKNAADYRDAQKTELAGAIATGKAAIDAAADTAGVDLAVNNTKAAMDAIKTNAQLTAEELTAFKDTAKASLGTYKNPADYREAQKNELSNAITAGKSAIEEAQNEAAVSAALQQAKAAIDQIKTDAQLTKEEHPEKSFWGKILEFLEKVYNFFKNLFHSTL